MGGRFKAGFEFREIKVRWQIFNDLDFMPHYNIAPTQTDPHRRARRRRRSAADALGLGALLSQGSGDRQQQRAV